MPKTFSLEILFLGIKFQFRKSQESQKVLKIERVQFRVICFHEFEHNHNTIIQLCLIYENRRFLLSDFSHQKFQNS